jgi:hypothetical protein
VAVGLVVPGEEALAVGSGGFDRGKVAGEVGPIFEGLVVNTNVEGGRGRWQSIDCGAVREMEVCWPSRAALRGEALNHRELHWLKTVVVSVAGKGAAVIASGEVREDERWA